MTTITETKQDLADNLSASKGGCKLTVSQLGKNF